jgi:hypothetical protein
MTNGVKVGGFIGIDLSSTTGYHTNAKVVVNLHSLSRQICGTDGYPEQSPGRIVVNDL